MVNTNIIIWVDDLISDYDDILPNLDNFCTKNRLQLLLASGDNEKLDSNSRGFNTIKKLQTILDKHRYSATDIAGFILDIQIPIRNLGIFGEKYTCINTNRGADTGYRIAEYIISNKGGNLSSPYGDKYAQIPILFNSVDRFPSMVDVTGLENQNISWMDDLYDTNHGTQYTKYSYLEKRFTMDIFEMYSDWIRFVTKYPTTA